MKDLLRISAFPQEVVKKILTKHTFMITSELSLSFDSALQSPSTSDMSLCDYTCENKINDQASISDYSS